MLPSFRYVRPRSVAEAVKALAEPGARAHAGGTDLVGCLRDGVFDAKSVVSLSGLAELKGISATKDGGPAHRRARDARRDRPPSPGSRRAGPPSRREPPPAASPQLRNQGTLGGNLCQRPRCWYFRGDFDCARKGGEICYAVDGENTYHAIFGGSGCFIVHPSDTASPLVALQATVQDRRAEGAAEPAGREALRPPRGRPHPRDRPRPRRADHRDPPPAAPRGRQGPLQEGPRARRLGLRPRRRRPRAVGEGREGRVGPRRPLRRRPDPVARPRGREAPRRPRPRRESSRPKPPSSP